MTLVLVDTCVITDIAEPNSQWFEWSARTLERLDSHSNFLINPVIYAEASIGYDTVEEVEEVFATLSFTSVEMPREALFLAGRAFLQYRRNKGTKASVLPDFFIGAHAAIEGYRLLTRDQGRFRTYFPTLDLITSE